MRGFAGLSDVSTLLQSVMNPLCVVHYEVKTSFGGNGFIAFDRLIAFQLVSHHYKRAQSESH